MSQYATPKTLARECALQALYQCQVGGETALEVERQFREERDLGKADKAFFAELLQGVSACLESIDAELRQFLDRRIEDLDPIERGILRLGVYELLNRLETPYRVVLNEAINLAKRYGASQSHKYVNSVLDKVARLRRAPEFGAARQG